MSAPSRAERLAGLTWRRGLFLVAAYAAWSAAVAPLLPAYARLVTPAAGALLDLLRPHGLEIPLEAAFPEVIWQLDGMPAGLCRIPFRLVSYNLVLFLALAAVWPALSLGRRALIAAAGLPLLWVFHTVDLCLAVESRLLTHLRPASYHLSQGVDLWFLAVKYYHSFSVLALKQILPFFLVWGLTLVPSRWPRQLAGRLRGPLHRLMTRC